MGLFRILKFNIASLTMIIKHRIITMKSSKNFSTIFKLRLLSMKSPLLFSQLLIAVLMCFLSCNGGTEKDNSGSPSRFTPTTTDTSKIDSPLYSDVMQPMLNMIDSLDKLKITSDYDIDYSNIMIIHHNGGIAMADLILAKGTDEKIKAIAKRISGQHEQEIKDLKVFQHGHKPVEAKTDHTANPNELTTAMSGMIQNIKAVSLSGNSDKDFAKLMVKHFEGAIAISTQEVINGHHVRLKLMARDLIADQKEIVAELKTWIDQH